MLPGVYAIGSLPIRISLVDGVQAGTVVAVDRHPTEPLIAIDLESNGDGESYTSGIWHAQSGELVMSFRDAHAMRWAGHGRRVWVAHDQRQRDPSKHLGSPVQIVSPLQSETSHHLSLVELDAMEPVKSIAYQTPSGWSSGMFITRDRSVAAMLWNEQDGGGYVLISLGDEPQVVEGGELITSGIQGGLAGPIETSDGRYLLSARGATWGPHSEEEAAALDIAELEDEDLDIATVYIHDLKTLEKRELPVRPKEPAFYKRLAVDEAAGMISELRLSGMNMLELVTEAGDVHVVKVPG